MQTNAESDSKNPDHFMFHYPLLLTNATNVPARQTEQNPMLASQRIVSEPARQGCLRSQSYDKSTGIPGLQSQPHDHRRTFNQWNETKELTPDVLGRESRMVIDIARLTQPAVCPRDYFSTIQIFLKTTGLPWFCRNNASGPGPSALRPGVP